MQSTPVPPYDQSVNPQPSGLIPSANHSIQNRPPLPENQFYHSPLTPDFLPLPKAEQKGIRVSKFLAGIITIGILSAGFGLGWGSNNFFSKPGEVEQELVGKWYSSDGEGSIWLKDNADYLVWDEIRFQCIDGSDSVRVSWVNDGYDDCDDGSDENPALNFDNGHNWDNGYSYLNSEGFNVEVEWYVAKDNNQFCVHVIADYSANLIDSVMCSKYSITGTVLWMSEADGGSVDCTPYVDLSRNNGPQLETGGSDAESEWKSQWDFAYSDYSTLKPNWCDEIKLN